MSDSASAVRSTSKLPTLAIATTARLFGSPSGRQPGGGRGGQSSRRRMPPSSSCWPWCAGTTFARSPRWVGVFQPAPPSRTSRGWYLRMIGTAIPSWSSWAWVRTSGVEPPHAGLSQAGEDRAAGRPGVEQDRRAAVLQQRRVALADVEEGDDEVARLGRAGRAEGGHDDEPGTAAATAAATSRPEPARSEPPGCAKAPSSAPVHRHARPASAIARRQRGVGQGQRRRAAEPHRAARPRAAARRRARPTRRRRAAAR